MDSPAVERKRVAFTLPKRACALQSLRPAYDVPEEALRFISIGRKSRAKDYVQILYVFTTVRCQ